MRLDQHDTCTICDKQIKNDNPTKSLITLGLFQENANISSFMIKKSSLLFHAECFATLAGEDWINRLIAKASAGDPPVIPAHDDLIDSLNHIPLSPEMIEKAWKSHDRQK